MGVISLKDVTKDYGHGRGIFDVSFDVQEGSVFGFLGPNGAGKTTAIRHIMGFSKPQKGTVRVNQLDSWTYASQIQQNLGYLPGEIALPEHLTGTAFIQMMKKLRGMETEDYLHELLDYFDLDCQGAIKRMSLGVKRKLAIVVAFMHDPAILVLDEPTSGLDPIMQKRFIQFIQKEKARGKTILLSSHMFSEVEATCDDIAIIKDGVVVATFDVAQLKETLPKKFKLQMQNQEALAQLQNHLKEVASIEEINGTEMLVSVPRQHLTSFIQRLASHQIEKIHEIPFHLESYFMKFYER
ncbi:ABC transporter ATP-binding protein [Lysinibacillus sp. LZ02]|uniref:ABC transporter ATP-binding protein n=1 Tax=Lysinibacillus sp. LZ02 TaxID=3420668 RepID=UPI003D3669F2